MENKRSSEASLKTCERPTKNLVFPAFPETKTRKINWIIPVGMLQVLMWAGFLFFEKEPEVKAPGRIHFIIHSSKALTMSKHQNQGTTYLDTGSPALPLYPNVLNQLLWKNSLLLLLLAQFPVWLLGRNIFQKNLYFSRSVLGSWKIRPHRRPSCEN